jgi:hypothetical protein
MNARDVLIFFGVLVGVALEYIHDLETWRALLLSP